MPNNNQNQMHSKAIVLNGQWTLWYLESDRKKIWEEMQNIVHTFSMVDDFSSIYNHIRQPSEIRQGNDYSVFKNNMRPLREDAANINGGLWVLNVAKKYRRSKLDDLWFDTLLCIMGEAFEFHEHINGAVVSVRHQGDRIAIWTSDAEEKSVLAIGNKLIRLDSDFKLYFKLHSADKHSKPLYTI